MNKDFDDNYFKKVPLLKDSDFEEITKRQKDADEKEAQKAYKLSKSAEHKKIVGYFKLKVTSNVAALVIWAGIGVIPIYIGFNPSLTNDIKSLANFFSEISLQLLIFSVIGIDITSKNILNYFKKVNKENKEYYKQRLQDFKNEEDEGNKKSTYHK